MSEVTETETAGLSDPVNWWKLLVILVIGTLPILWGLHLIMPRGIGGFFDLASMQFIFAPLCISAAYLYWRKSISPFEVFLVLGIPLGLLGGNIGFHGFAMNITDPSEAGEATSIGLLTALFGAFASSIGYFGSRFAESSQSARISGADLAFCLVVFAVFWILPMSQGVGLLAFMSPQVLLTYVGFIVLAIFLKRDEKKSLVHCVSDAALAGALFSLVAAIVVWFGSSNQVSRTAIGFGSLGVMYGTIIYIVCYFVSLKTGDSKKINFTTKNWHLVEANTFYVFLIVAPVNLIESITNEQEKEERIEMTQKHDALRSEVALLTERLAKLEDS